MSMEKQRTYALVGTGGCGKTSLAEMLLFQAGIINRLGAIEEGTTALDYEPEEIKRRGSIQPGFASFDWKGCRHNLIDVPGDANFSGDIEWLLSAADSAVTLSYPARMARHMTGQFSFQGSSSRPNTSDSTAVIV